MLLHESCGQMKLVLTWDNDICHLIELEKKCLGVQFTLLITQER